ncbi:MAG: type ISP restriction/modification enzyme [Acidobacteriaceae bacterium]
MSTLKLKPTHAPVKAYYEALENFGRGKFDNEGNIRGAFEDLLKKCARQFDWLLVPEYQIKRKAQNPIRIDGALLDAFNLPRGYWEAKDSKDDLEAEMKNKFEAGYPRTNILFQSPTQALLFQNGRTQFHGPITDPEKLVDVLCLFFEYREPHQEDWEKAVESFSVRIPEIAAGALQLITDEKKTNKRFQESFGAFAELCRQSINPDLKDGAVEEMLVQHLLTERIFRKIFDNPEFTRRNVIAAEIEKVIATLTQKHFSRDAFLKSLDHFYKAIEEAAATMESYQEKQAFLNRVYERFFQGFNKKQADTHGIVYTPQPIVDFMVRSVEEVLQTEFGKSLSDTGVHILDPFVGTGNFITRVMQEIKTSRLPQKYRNELHCNEVMLLPYYIASMNIEHAYLERTQEYEPFEGVCLVDTFELAEPKQAGFEFMTVGNTERIKKQKKAPIFVVIGNPPYNAWQENENDQNRNRKYPYLAARIAETYSKYSGATNKNALADPYVKAFRWASDRIKAGGLVCFVSNDSFIDQLAFDGMRRCLSREFDKVYVLDLGGNVRKNPKLSGTTHNVFGIQVGVSITILVRDLEREPSEAGKIFYARVPEDWRKTQKYTQLEQWNCSSSVQWKRIKPDDRNTWLTDDAELGFSKFMEIAKREVKEGIKQEGAVFHDYSGGAQTNRDAWSYNFSRRALETNLRRLIDFYNSEMRRWKREHSRSDRIESFLKADPTKIKWCSKLMQSAEAGAQAVFQSGEIRTAMYRPFTLMFLYFEDAVTHRRGRLPYFFPTPRTENRMVWVKVGSEWPMFALAVKQIPDLLPQGSSQCFPFYAYDEDGMNRRENITDWALGEFRKHYADKSISKSDIFHATYAILHHPQYRTRYAANLKRDLPRIPFVPEFREYAKIGAALMKLHIEYEQQPEYPLERTEKGTLDWRVEKMALSKDKTQLRYNDFLTLSGIPPEVYEYRLGNRSALEWVVDQYRVTTDARSGIVNDPNREDDPEYIVRLIGQVVTVSVETVKLVSELATLKLLPEAIQQTV